MTIKKFIIPLVLCSILGLAIFITTKSMFYNPIKVYKNTPSVEVTKPIVNKGTDGPVKAVNVADRKVNTYVILDPGHGGVDYGTVSGNVFEKTINLNIANRLMSLLTKNGYKVSMTRNRDVLLADRSSISGTLEKRDLDARTKLVKSCKASMFISLHVNSDPSQPQRNGSIVYYNPEVTGSAKLAGILQNELNKVTLKGKNRASNISSSADFYILKNTDIPGVLVETGFITNKTEKEGFLQEKFRTDLANAIYNGIKKYNQKSMVLANIKKESVSLN